MRNNGMTFDEYILEAKVGDKMACNCNMSGTDELYHFVVERIDPVHGLYGKFAHYKKKQNKWTTGGTSLFNKKMRDFNFRRVLKSYALTNNGTLHED